MVQPQISLGICLLISILLISYTFFFFKRKKCGMVNARYFSFSVEIGSGKQVHFRKGDSRKRSSSSDHVINDWLNYYTCA